MHAWLYCHHSSPAIPITVSVIGSVAAPIVRTMYSLICTVTGAEDFPVSTITYQWFKNGGVVLGQTMDTLSFTSLTFSNAGRYTCEANVTYVAIFSPSNATSVNSVDVVLTCKILHVAC